VSERVIIGRNVNRHGQTKGDLARIRAAELGISRATWFRRVKAGLNQSRRRRQTRPSGGRHGNFAGWKGNAPHGRPRWQRTRLRQ
jgi:hypothetical protein